MKLYGSRYSYDKYDHKECKQILIKSLKGMKNHQWIYINLTEYEEDSDYRYYKTNKCAYTVLVDFIKRIMVLYYSNEDKRYLTVRKMKFKMGFICFN